MDEVVGGGTGVSCADGTNDDPSLIFFHMLQEYKLGKRATDKKARELLRSECLKLDEFASFNLIGECHQMTGGHKVRNLEELYICANAATVRFPCSSTMK